MYVGSTQNLYLRFKKDFKKHYPYVYDNPKKYLLVYAQTDNMKESANMLFDFLHPDINQLHSGQQAIKGFRTQ